MLFLMFPLAILGEINISTNLSLLDPLNLEFLASHLAFFAVLGVILQLPKLEKTVKYVVVIGMLILFMYKLYIFNEHPIVYQLVYINLALSLLYLDGTLILFSGISAAIATALGFIFWKPVFFPHFDDNLANIPIIILLQTTLVLWGVTQIGRRFVHFVDHNRKMQRLLQENENQLLLIHEQNKALTEYAKQVEQLAILEERNRISQELHDTIGHTLTSMIAGLELVKVQAEGEQDSHIETLLYAARKGLEDIRDHVHQTEKSSDETLVAQIEKLSGELAKHTGADIRFHFEQDFPELPQEHRLVLLRCTQEGLTNAVRHGQADAIDIRLRRETDQFCLEISDNGTGMDPDRTSHGYGLSTMRKRIESLHGMLRVKASPGQGVQLICSIPAIPIRSAKTIHLLLAEDQPLIAESFGVLLGMEPDLKVSGIAVNGMEAVNFCEREAPDLVLMDIHMPEMNGIEATRVIKQKWPQIKIIMLTTFQDLHHAAEAISLGADGYLLKNVQPRYLTEAIRIVCSGGTLISMETARLLVAERQKDLPPDRDEYPEAMERKKAQEASRYSLTEKEIEIIQLLSDGLKYKDIAKTLHFSESTVKNYVSIIYSKLNVDNRMQAVKKAQEKLLL